MTIVVTERVHFATSSCGKRTMQSGEAPKPVEEPTGRVQRVARLMALAIRFERLIREGSVRDQAEIATLGYVTRARVTQVMNLLHLAPDIQEAVLFLPLMTEGRDPVTERDLRPIAAEINWARQRDMWEQLRVSRVC